MSYMKLFDSYNPSSVLGCLMLVAATPAIAYPSVTQICTEVGVELKKGGQGRKASTTGAGSNDASMQR